MALEYSAAFRKDTTPYDILLKSLKAMGRPVVAAGAASVSMMEDSGLENSHIDGASCEEQDYISDFDFLSCGKERNAGIFIQECSLELLKSYAQVFSHEIVSEQRLSDGSVKIAIKMG